MKTALRLRALTAGFFAVILAVMPGFAPALAQDKAQDKGGAPIPDKLDKVSFGTNWVAEAEHGGFFQKMVKAGVVKSDLDYRKSYTLRFVNKAVGVELRSKQ